MSYTLRAQACRYTPGCLGSQYTAARRPDGQFAPVCRRCYFVLIKGCDPSAYY